MSRNDERRKSEWMMLFDGLQVTKPKGTLIRTITNLTGAETETEIREMKASTCKQSNRQTEGNRGRGKQEE